MADDPVISVIVASHQRPKWLHRCLTALAQLDYPSFEIIVAADETGLAAIKDHPARGFLKTTLCPNPNISETRNAGLALAAGDFVAFIDDDAVPEPLWLRHFADAFAQTGAAACVGYVRGRNGISFQSRAESIDSEGESHSEQSPESQAIIPDLETGRAVKLVGTNFAIRRDILCELGGFDPAYRYFLDDSDVSLRLSRAGHRAAVAPLAEVHHATASSSRRTSLRCPCDLSLIGNSSAVYLRRHSTPSKVLFARIHDRERRRLERHLVQGTCEPRDISRLLATLKAGWDEGLRASLPDLRSLAISSDAPLCVPPKPPGHRVISVRRAARGAAIETAHGLVAAGHRASVFSFSLTIVPQRVRFLPEGVWLQTGGQFGKSLRSAAVFRWCRFARRVEEETRRVAKQRGSMTFINPQGTIRDKKVHPVQ